MTTIKATTKRGQMLVSSARNYEGTTLNEVYGNASYAKHQALNHCMTLCYNEGGRNFRIISHNTFNFSVAWDMPDGSVRIETRDNSYHVK